MRTLWLRMEPQNREPKEVSHVSEMAVPMEVKTPLRTCRGCGRKAYTIEDLKYFKKNPKYKHGHQNRCHSCGNKHIQKRNQQLIDSFPKPLFCHFCNDKIEGKGTRYSALGLVIHSLDENHNNWQRSNKVPAHNRCHLIHHKPPLIGKDNPKWKGENAKPESIKRRNTRRKQRGIPIEN